MGYFSLIAILDDRIRSPASQRTQGIPTRYIMQRSHAGLADESHGMFPRLLSEQTTPPRMGHAMFGHSFEGLPQWTSHLQEFAQSIEGHDIFALQLISHGAAPQLIAPHEEGLEQWISQLLPSAQSIGPQAFGSLQWIVQSKPAGQWTLAHVVVESQSILHPMSASQDEHWLGHAPRTQYPLSQVRPVSQSLFVLQM